MSGSKIEKVPEIIRIPSQEIDLKAIGLELLREEERLSSDRSEFTSRLRDYILNWDDYFMPRVDSKNKPWSGSSDFHIPITMWVARAIHANAYDAVSSNKNWIHVVANEKLDVEKTQRVFNWMKWAILSWINRNKGILNAVDDFLWDWSTVGWGVMERGWDKYYRKTLKLKDLSRESMMDLNDYVDSDMPFDAEEMMETEPEIRFQEIFELDKIHDCPFIRTISHEDVMFPIRIQDVTDMDEPQILWIYDELEEHDLNQFKNQEFWDADAVDTIIERTRHETATGSSTKSHLRREIKRLKDAAAGGRHENRQSKASKKFEFGRVYTRMDIDNDGYAEECLFMVHTQTGIVPYWNYLDRITKTKSRPVYKCDYIRRPRNTLALGPVELMYPINREADAVHNFRMDTAALTATPWGLIRGTSTLKPEDVRIEPGILIPVDDVNNDIRMIEQRDKTGFGREEESILIQYAQFLSGINPMQLGSTPSPVGGSRTVGGGLTMLQQAAKLARPQVSRLAQTLEKLLKDLYIDMTYFAPPGLEFRVLGSMGKPKMDMNGMPTIQNIENPEDFRYNLDFRVDLLSMVSSPEIEEQKAIMRWQNTVNPVTMQTRLVTSINMYNMLRDIHIARGDVDVEEYVTKPENAERPLDISDEIASINQGDMPRIVLADQHQVKMQALQMFYTSESFKEGMRVGTIHKAAPRLYQMAMMQHASMRQAMNEAFANQQMNPQDNQALRSSGLVETQSGKPIAEKQQAEPNPEGSRGGGGQFNKGNQPEGQQGGE